MYNLFVNILWTVFLIDLVALGVLMIFFVNARINLTRQAKRTRFFLRALHASHNKDTSFAAAESLGISLDEFTTYCQNKGIESPEDRFENIKRIEEEKVKQEERIIQEEAAWHEEQERLIDERQQSQVQEAKERRDRLKKFGFR